MDPKDPLYGYYTAHPNVRSRFFKTLIRCPLCDKPIGERLGNQWWFMAGNNKQFAKTAVIMGQDVPHGSYEVKCSDSGCEGSHLFAWINNKFGVHRKINTEIIDNDSDKS